MRTRRIAAAVLVTFLSSAVSLPAVAQSSDDAVTLQARQRFKEGVDFFDRGKYEEARLAFLQAYTLKKHPAVLLNLAQSSSKAGHHLEAAKYFKQFLKDAPNASPQQRKDAEAGIADARQRLGRIDVVAPPGTEITLDDTERVGTTPLPEPIDVEPGPHTLKSPTETVKVTAVVGARVEAKFGGSSGAAAAASTPTTSATDSPGEAQPPSEQSTGGTVGEDSPRRHASLLSPPENMTPVYVGLAAAGVGLVGAILFAAFKADAQSKADTVANDIRRAANQRGISTQGVCSNTDAQIQRDFGQACSTLRDNNDKVDTNATVANVSLVVMGAGLALAAGWYLFAPKRDDGNVMTGLPKRPVITPYAGWQSGGLQVSGSF